MFNCIDFPSCLAQIHVMPPLFQDLNFGPSFRILGGFHSVKIL